MICKKCGKEFNSENNICTFCNYDNNIEGNVQPIENLAAEPLLSSTSSTAAVPTEEVEDLFEDEKKEEPVKVEVTPTPAAPVVEPVQIETTTSSAAPTAEPVQTEATTSSATPTAEPVQTETIVNPAPVVESTQEETSITEEQPKSQLNTRTIVMLIIIVILIIVTVLTYLPK